jgi:hypothetical protein
MDVSAMGLAAMGRSELHPVTPQSNGNAARQTISFRIVGAFPLFSDVFVIMILTILAFAFCLFASSTLRPGTTNCYAAFYYQVFTPSLEAMICLTDCYRS